MSIINWDKIFESFLKKKVLVIGDVMVDNYLWGNVNRISPEAPVPIVSINKKESRLGGAANVALNIQALGATPVLCSVIGDDIPGNLFVSLLKNHSLSTEGILQDNKRSTTVKTRVIAHQQQLIRVDEEIDIDLDPKQSEKLFGKISGLIKKLKPDALIFEDYDKGVLTAYLIEKIIHHAKKSGIKIAVDPKKKNFNNYKGATLFKPNLKELKEGTKSDSSDLASIKKIVGKLKNDHNHDIILLTLSDKGLLVYADDLQKIIPAHVRQIADVSGAGDTVISVATLCLASGASPELLGVLANLAGGLVCESVGVVPVNREQLLAETRKIRILS